MTGLSVTGLSIRGLTVHRGKAMVLEDISFSAPQGAVTAILGLAGSGKTTLLAGIAGMIPLSRGAVLQGGVDITRKSAARRDIFFLAPGTSLKSGGSVKAAIGRHWVHATSLLPLAPLAGRSVSTLSHGESMLALAGARLGPGGATLLVDEAGSGLDVPAMDSLLEAFHSLAAAGHTVVFATRAPSLALAAHHLVLLASGRVLQTGEPASLYDEPRDATAARLTGPCNILCGQMRELRNNAFTWTCGGRFVQSADPDAPRPVLGGEVRLCLRPERVALLASGEPAENAVEGRVTSLRAAGPRCMIVLDTPLGPLTINAPTWQTRIKPSLGMTLRAGWAAGAASVIGP